MRSRLLVLAAWCLACGSVTLIAADWPQWRGPNRTGHSAESGLMQQWPAQGPAPIWKITDAGYGFGTPSVSGDRFYLVANEGLADEFVRAFNVNDGRQVWSTRIGKVGNPEQDPSYPGARSTPTVEGDSIYAFGSDGDLVALDTRTGRVRWQTNVRRLGGEPGTWGYSESPIVDGSQVVVTPGGRASMAAFNKQTGEVVWTAAVPNGGTSAYSSITIAQVRGITLYTAILQNFLVGIDSKDGKLLWQNDRTTKGCAGAFPTPVFNEGYLYSACNQTGGSLLMLEFERGTVVPEPLYHERRLPGEKGGAVLVGGYLYGTNSQALMCWDFLTGEIKWQDRAVGAAAIVFADGRLYVRGENGAMALAEPSTTGYLERGRFTPPGPPDRSPGPARWGPAGAWPHPVVANGRLYLRDLGTVWSYDIRRAS